MASYCKLTPDAPNGKPSGLFTGLKRLLGNRDAAKWLWAFTHTPLFRSEFSDLAKDENGEVQVDTLVEAMGLGDYISKSSQDLEDARKLGLIAGDGRPAVFDRADIALSKASEFNASAQRKIAVVRKTDDGRYATEVTDNTPLNIARADRNEARRKLNMALIQMMQRVGFNVEFADDPASGSFFDPLLAEDNARNLKTVIRLANGEAGLNALPEEVAHTILAGLRDRQLKARLDALMTPDVVHSILGDSYGRYAERYRNGRTSQEQLLKEEAEGHLLARMVAGERDSSSARRSLLSRLWSLAKRLLGGMSEGDIDNAIANAEQVLRPIADTMSAGWDIEPLVSKEDIMAHERLYADQQYATALEGIAQSGLQQLQHKRAILRNSLQNTDTSDLSRRIKEVETSISRQKYKLSASQILKYIYDDLAGIEKRRDELGLGRVYNASTDLNVIRMEADDVFAMGTALQGWEQWLGMFDNLGKYVKDGQIDLNDADLQEVMKQAATLREHVLHLQTEYRNMRYQVIRQFMLLFYGDMGNKPDSFNETDLKWQSIDQVLNGAARDIGFWDTNLFSAGDSTNPLINVIHAVIAKRQAARNTMINGYVSRIHEARARLQRAGHSDDFIYQLDSDGIPTGFFVGPIDYNRFYSDREKYRADWLEQHPDATPEELQKEMEAWDGKHSKDKITGTDPLTGAEIHVHRPVGYDTPDYDAGWDQAQKDYYKAITDMKDELDAMLPPSLVTKGLAPQVRRSVTQMFDRGVKDALKTFWGQQKRKFAVVEDNTDYPGYDVRTVDFANRPIKRVPVYYANRMKDMHDLSTDSAKAMAAYATSAVNYSEMSKVASAMRLLEEHVKEEYTVDQYNGSRQIFGRIPVGGGQQDLVRPYRKTGLDTEAGRAAVGYIDRQVFGMTKNRIGKMKLPFGKEADLDTLTNLAMRLVSTSRIGLNMLSGITNRTQGEAQMLGEAISGRAFNVKDYAWSEKEYSRLLLGYMGQFNAIDRHDRLYLLINRFNAMEDYFRDMVDRDWNASAGKRVIGRGNIFFLNTMGEHALHCKGMLAVLKHEKVKRLSDKETVSLYDVIKPVHDGSGWHLELSSDIQFIDRGRPFLSDTYFKGKTTITSEDSGKLFDSLAVYINSMNDSMHGGYSELEKGNYNQKVLGRFLMQFRQWMFGQYSRMFSRQYYDALTNTRKEGAYNSIWRFISNTAVDMKNMGLKAGWENNHMSAEEKANAMVAWTQTGLFILICALISAMKGWKDDDDLAKRLMLYSCNRLQMELGAQVPYPKTFFDNMFTLVQSPMPAMNMLQTVNDIWDTSIIHSGRFKNWPRGLKSAFALTPFYNVMKLTDMSNYNYMFNIFNKRLR